MSERHESNTGWDRRSFLRAAGMLGVGAVIGAGAQSLFDVARIRRGMVGVSRTRLAMGTYVTMTAVHESEHAAEEAIGHAFDEVDRLIAVFSRHDSTTPVSVLNANGRVTLPPPELVDVLERSVALHGVTTGAFDVTVQPLVDLYGASPRGQDYKPPSQHEVDEALARTGIDKLEVSDSRIELWDGAGLTLDGIAKGYVVDRASDVLAARGATRHMVNAGGDIRTRGVREDGQLWTIAVEDPKKRGDHPDVIRMRDGAVATSGNYEIYFDSERLYHHVVNPADGATPAHYTSVSVVAPSVVEADALSTAVFVMAPGDGLRLIDEMRAKECLVVDREGRTSTTSGWREAFERVG